MHQVMEMMSSLQIQILFQQQEIRRVLILKEVNDFEQCIQVSVGIYWGTMGSPGLVAEELADDMEANHSQVQYEIISLNYQFC